MIKKWRTVGRSKISTHSPPLGVALISQMPFPPENDDNSTEKLKYSQPCALVTWPGWSSSFLRIRQTVHTLKRWSVFSVALVSVWFGNVFRSQGREGTLRCTFRVWTFYLSLRVALYLLKVVPCRVEREVNNSSSQSTREVNKRSSQQPSTRSDGDRLAIEQELHTSSRPGFLSSDSSPDSDTSYRKKVWSSLAKKLNSQSSMSSQGKTESGQCAPNLQANAQGQDFHNLQALLGLAQQLQAVKVSLPSADLSKGHHSSKDSAGGKRKRLLESDTSDISASDSDSGLYD